MTAPVWVGCAGLLGWLFGHRFGGREYCSRCGFRPRCPRCGYTTGRLRSHVREAS